MASDQSQLWQHFLELEESDTDASEPDSAGGMAAKASSGSKSKQGHVTLSPQEQEQAITYIFEQSLEHIIHDILLDVHRAEKTARIQSAVIELEQKAESLGRSLSQEADNGQTGTEEDVIETDGALLRSGKIYLKGNPFKTVKTVLCPNCRLPRLLYPRVGFNSRPPPDPNQQYCKNEPAIIIDKHDVHGQRKKGVKVKGQTKGKNKKKADAASPASSDPSDPLTPSTSSAMADSFEFKEIEYPAAKCPNKESHLGDHWKSVNVFATHLNGSCYLKRDRAAGREAVAKISGTPRDSRASSPKATNGVKRARAAEEIEVNGKKKQKADTPKKNTKTLPPPSKLRDSLVEDKEDNISFKSEISDTVEVAPKGDNLKPVVAEGDQSKPKVNGTSARKKPTKAGKKG